MAESIDEGALVARRNKITAELNQLAVDAAELGIEVDVNVLPVTTISSKGDALNRFSVPMRRKL